MGSTTQFMHTRHVGHAHEVREESTPLGRHFALPGLNNMTVQMIDCIQEGREDAEEALRCLEGVWQHTDWLHLKCMAILTQGMN